jgi:hypothetical protein
MKAPVISGLHSLVLVAAPLCACATQHPAPASPEPATATGTASAAEGCAPPALFCDGFEDDGVGQSPGAPWRDETGPSGATVNVDDARAFSGRHAVHVLAPRGASYRRGYFAIHQPPVFPSAAHAMYGRVMVWMDVAPVALAGQHDVHWTFIQGEGRSADDTYNSLYRYGGQHQGGLGLMANFETTPPVRSDCWQHSASTLPVQQWACVEWHFDGATNQMQLWLEGKELSDLQVTDRASGPESGCLSSEHLGGQWLAPPAFQSLYLGFERYQDTQSDENLWIDDVVVSTGRVGCPSAPATQGPPPAGG